MPYIKKELRKLFYPSIKSLSSKIDGPGPLNFCITKLCINFINSFSADYKNYNAIIGVLECVKQEFYRRAMITFENGKIAENGDVY